MRKHKKLFALVLALLVIVSLFAGCTKSYDDDDDDDYEYHRTSTSEKGKKEKKTPSPSPTDDISKSSTVKRIQDAGKIVIATDSDFYPFEYIENNTIKGIDFDIMEIVAQKLGVKIEIKEMFYDDVLSGIQTADFDIGASGILFTEERQEKMLLTDPYCFFRYPVVVRKGSQIGSKDELKGKKIIVEEYTAEYDFASAEGYDILISSSAAEAMLELASGKADAWITNSIYSSYLIKNYNITGNTELVIIDEFMPPEKYVFACPFGSEDLVSEINTILKEIIEDGTMDSILEKYALQYNLS